MKNNRVCPHCHHTISRWNAAKYYRIGVNDDDFAIRCNHCHEQVRITGGLNWWLPLLYGFVGGFTFCTGRDLLGIDSTLQTILLLSLPIILVIWLLSVFILSSQVRIREQQ